MNYESPRTPRKLRPIFRPFKWLRLKRTFIDSAPYDVSPSGEIIAIKK